MSQASAEGETPLSPAAALAVLNNQQRIVSGRLGSNVWIITGTWGVAWLLGFLVIWAMDSHFSGFALQTWLGWTIFAALFAAAIVVSAVLGIRSGRGIRSNSANSFTGTVYGVTWAVAMLSISVFGAGLLSHGMTAGLADLFYPSAYTLLVGILYLAAAAIWRIVQMIVAGAFLVLLAVVAPFLGHPTNYLVFGIAGGAMFLTLAIVGAVRLRSAVARG
ncbi:MAG: hypothetical protein QOD50_2330 [Actinomycetota bacterium]|jgi:hypothetical protein|nr:hypothetical protein [Actinomycetota bacterium]